MSRQTESFEAVAREWFEKFSPGWAASHAATISRRLERDVFPWLSTRPAREITPLELLNVLRRVEARGTLETAHRIHQVCGQVFRYAIATGRAQRDPCTDLRGALPPVPQRHHAALTRPAEVGALLRAINGYRGSFVVVQCGPATGTPWSLCGRASCAGRSGPFEFDLAEAVWRIPSARMKMRQEHLVPLARQALEILHKLQPVTGSRSYVFPSARTGARPMSENAVTAALRRLGYERGEMTGHGFRTVASTLLNELGWPGDVIERQLAHAERDNVRNAYNRAEYWVERQRMMQSWADYLDGLAGTGSVATADAPSTSLERFKV